MKRGIYPGSFDPMTVGHLNIIRRAADLFDSIIVAVLQNVGKTVFFPVEERLELVKIATKDIGNVEVMLFNGLLVDFMSKMNCGVAIRGIRNTLDYEYEIQLTNMNRLLDNNVETLFLPAMPQHAYISSTLVREAGILGGDISKMVPESIYQQVKDGLLR